MLIFSSHIFRLAFFFFINYFSVQFMEESFLIMLGLSSIYLEKRHSLDSKFLQIFTLDVFRLQQYNLRTMQQGMYNTSRTFRRLFHHSQFFFYFQFFICFDFPLDFHFCLNIYFQKIILSIECIYALGHEKFYERNFVKPSFSIIGLTIFRLSETMSVYIYIYIFFSYIEPPISILSKSIINRNRDS